MTQVRYCVTVDGKPLSETKEPTNNDLKDKLAANGFTLVDETEFPEASKQNVSMVGPSI